MKAKLLFFLCLILGGISSFICLGSLLLNIIYDKPFNLWWFIIFGIAIVCLITIAIMDIIKNKRDESK